MPLGSTTYHFATLDELMVAALRQANEGFARSSRREAGLEDPGADLAVELPASWGSGSRATAPARSWSTSSTSPRCAAPPCAPSPPSGADDIAGGRPPHGPTPRGDWSR